jgi:putative transposase
VSSATARTRSFKSKADARVALFSYIEGWYNPRRRHSGLGRIAPAEFERRYGAQSFPQTTPEIDPETA